MRGVCAALVCGTAQAASVMWFVGKPVLDLSGHLGKDRRLAVRPQPSAIINLSKN